MEKNEIDFLKFNCKEIIEEILSKNNHPNMIKLENIIPNLSTFYNDEECMIYEDKIKNYVENSKIEDLVKIFKLKKATEPKSEKIVFANPQHKNNNVIFKYYEPEKYHEKCIKYHQDQINKIKNDKIKLNERFKNSEPENPFYIF